MELGSVVSAYFPVFRAVMGYKIFQQPSYIQCSHLRVALTHIIACSVVNLRRACAARVSALGLCVSLSVCLFVYIYS